jgi:hypothetical protein
LFVRELLTLVRFGLTALPLTLAGKVVRVRPTSRAATRSGYGRAAALIALPIALLIIYLVGAGWLYPLRPDAIENIGHPFAATMSADTWGGPSLAGAWAVHTLVALALQAICLGLLYLCRIAFLRKAAESSA